MRLTRVFSGTDARQPDIDEYDKQGWRQIEYIRQFIVLHHHVTHRQDLPFRRACRATGIPAAG